MFIATTIGTAGRLGVADRFFGLRHDAVIGRDDQHRDIGDIGPAGPHLGERFVTRRIDERDVPAVFRLDRIRANVLRDAARFAGNDIGANDLVQQRRLAVIDVAEHRDDRRPRLQACSASSSVLSKRAKSSSSSVGGVLNSTSSPSSDAISSTYSSGMTALMFAMMPDAH